MKLKTILSVLLLLLLASCSNNETYLVDFIVDDQIYHQEEVEHSSKIAKIDEPTKEGYEFIGWYDEDLKWIFSLNIVTKNKRLVAKFKEKEVEVVKSSKTYLKNTLDEFTIYKFETNVPGPTIFIIGGIHGDERAGWNAALRMLDYKFIRGTTYVLPQANKRAITSNPPVRLVGTNLNRVFPGNVNGNDVEVLGYTIYEAIKSVNPDLVLDLHESRGSYKDGYLGDQIINDYGLYNFYLSDVLKELNKLELLSDNPAFGLDTAPPIGSINKTYSNKEDTPVFTIETNRGNLTGTIYDETIDLEKRIEIQLAIVDIILRTFERII